MAFTSHTIPAAASPLRRWWREPMVWLVISGPAIVVVASFVTYYLAARGAEVPLNETISRSQAAQPGALQPALNARNHAATPR